MAAANLPTPPVSAAGTTVISGDVAAWIAGLAYRLWISHLETLDARESTSLFNALPGAGAAAGVDSFASLNSDLRDQWTREALWLMASPGSSAAELYRAEAENAVRLGWRYGTFSVANKLHPYIDYNQFEGELIATPNIRGFQNLPQIEQMRFQSLVAVFGMNRNRLLEPTTLLEQNDSDPSLFGMAAPTAFDQTNLIVDV